MSGNHRTAILDPIDVVSGECYVERVDFRLPGPIPLEWRAYYSSQLNENGPLGLRWTHTLHQYLLFDQGRVLYCNGGGGVVVLPSLPSVGVTVASPDGRYLLAGIERDQWELRTPDGLRYQFSRSRQPGRARLDQIVDQNQHALRMLYNSLDHLTQVTDTARRQLRLELDLDGRILSVKCRRDLNEQVTLVRYVYDEAGRLIEVIDANDCSNFYQYDSHHQLLKRTDRTGYSFHYRYENGLCIHTHGDTGLYSGDLTYDLEKRQSRYVGFDGRTIVYHYDENGLVTKEIDPYGRATVTQFDPLGNPLVIMDRCQRPTSFQYDERGNKIAEISPTGAKSSWKYDPQNRVIEESDPSGQKVQRQYDPQGNLAREEASDGSETVCRYNQRGLLEFRERTGQVAERYEYDQFQQLTLVTDAYNGRLLRKLEYDLLGNVVALQTPRGRIQYVYDRMSRLIETRYEDGTCERGSYDGEGNPTSYTNRTGHVWRYVRHIHGQLNEWILPNGQRTLYEYTNANELSKVTLADGLVYEFQYDRCDHVVAFLVNGQIYDEYDRDAEGRLIQKRALDGSTSVSLEYKMSDSPFKRVFRRGEQFIENVLAITPNGQIENATNGFASIQSRYTAQGQIASESSGAHGVVHQIDPYGRTWTTTFDEQIEFKSRHSPFVRWLRDPTGQWHALFPEKNGVERIRFASGVTFQRHRSTRGVILHESIVRDGASQPVLDAHYRYDVEGRLKRVEDAGRTDTIRYDTTGRVLEVVRDAAAGSERFTYDAAGRLQALQTATPPSQVTRREHDFRGRLASLTRDNGTVTTFLYDTLDQLIQVQTRDSNCVYGYDARRRRIFKDLDGQKTQFGWEGDRLSWEIFADGRRRSYFYASPGDDCPLLFCESQLQADQQWKHSVYFVYHQRDRRPTLIFDAAGQVVWRADYTAFGRALVSPESRIQYSLRDPGQYEDQETGLHYNVHRYYDPDVGKYTQPDPVGLGGGLDLYAYAANNPFLCCDPLGLSET